jgi:glycerol-3-phosphate dehydrogenase
MAGVTEASAQELEVGHRRYSHEEKTDVVVIGAGSTGLFVALDLSLRGASVVVLDSQGIARGTSGRFHGLLHSGARYAVEDSKAAEECAMESATISRMAGHAVFDSGSYFVAFKGDDDAYIDSFRKALKDTDIKSQEVTISSLLEREPKISRDAYCAIAVPDMVIDPFRLLAGAAYMAKSKGATLHLHSKVTGITKSGVVKTSDGLELTGRVIVNSAGPWAAQVASLLGNELGLMPTIGAMLVYRPRLVNVVVNHLRPPSDGDIVLPFYDTNILGTTAQVVEDMDNVTVDDEGLQDLIYEGSKMVPDLKTTAYSRFYYSARPLFQGLDPRGISRDFEIVEDDPLVTILGGKLTTCRLIGEKVSDLVSGKLGLDAPCTTKEIQLEDVLTRTGPFSGTVGEEAYNLGANLSALEREMSS